jgi:hypothetical protein
MFAFLFLFLYRTLSGVQNGFGYAIRNKPSSYGAISFVSVILAVAPYLPILLTDYPALPLGAKMLAWTGAAISTIGAVAVWDNFTDLLRRFTLGIHFWEMWVTSGVTLCWIALGGNLYLIAAHVYPALLLHKGAVNIGSGLPFWDHRTDDPTGKTFSIPLLNIKVPRMTLRGRQILAVVSLVGAAVVLWKGYSFTLLNLL